jgi:WD40 repeat protein/predicted negative regulator of RcsB-dependent stress response
LGQQLIKLQHQSPVTSANFSPNGKLIVTASEDKTIRVWNTSGKQLYQIGLPKTSYFNPPESQTSFPNSEGIKISFSPDGQQIVTTGYDDIARVWFLSDKLLAQLAQLRLPIPHFLTGGGIYVQRNYSKQIKTTNFSPDGRWLVTAEKDGFASLWDTNGRLLVELIGHSDWINSASFSPDGKLIVTASWDKTTRVWNLNGKQIALLQHQDQVNNANFSPDGKLIITQSNDNTSRVWDLNGKQIALLQHQERVNNANFSPDNKLIVTASDDDTVHIWDLTGKQIVLFQGKTASFSPNGKLIVTTSDDDIIRVWNNSGQLLKQIKAPKGNIYYANFSPNGKFIITPSNNGITSVLDASGKLLLKLKGIVKETNFSPDSKLIVTQSSEQTMKLWNISGELLAELKHQSFVTGAIFSPDSKRIVTASDDDIARVWNTKGKLLATLKVSANTPISLKVKADRLRDLKFYAPNCPQALDPWQKALKFYEEISDNENQAVILEQLGNAHYCIGDYTNAIKSYSQASAIAQKFNYSQLQIKNLSNLGNVYNTLADYETAINKYNEALKLLPQENSQSKAEILRGRGNIYNSQGKYSEAIQDYLQALAIDEKIKNLSGIAENKVNLASIYLASGDANKATQYYKEALELKPIEALSGLGNVNLTLGDINKAIDFYSSSLAKAQQQEDKEGEGNALNGLGFALYKSGKLPDAEKNLRAAIEIWENLRTKLDDTNKVSIFEKQTRTYRLLQQVLIAQNKPDPALEIAEAGRGRAFVELIARRLSPNQQEQLKITPPNLEQIKQIAKTEKATLVQYSLITDELKTEGKQQTQESELYIWVIKPTSEVIFRKSDLKALLQKDNLTLEKLVTTSRESIGVRGRGRYYC